MSFRIAGVCLVLAVTMSAGCVEEPRTVLGRLVNSRELSAEALRAVCKSHRSREPSRHGRQSGRCRHRCEGSERRDRGSRACHGRLWLPISKSSPTVRKPGCWRNSRNSSQTSAHSIEKSSTCGTGHEHQGPAPVIRRGAGRGRCLARRAGGGRSEVAQRCLARPGSDRRGAFKHQGNPSTPGSAYREPDDAVMNRLEERIGRAQSSAQKNLSALATAARTESKPAVWDATTALNRFLTVHTEIVKLSRRNSNVRALALALGRRDRSRPCARSICRPFKMSSRGARSARADQLSSLSSAVRHHILGAGSCPKSGAGLGTASGQRSSTNEPSRRCSRCIPSTVPAGGHRTATCCVV